MNSTAPVFPNGLSYSDIGLLQEIVHLGAEEHWYKGTDGMDRLAAAGLLKLVEHHGQMTYVVILPDAGIFLDRPDVAEVYQNEYIRQSHLARELEARHIRTAFPTRHPGALRDALIRPDDDTPRGTEPLTQAEAQARFFDQFTEGADSDRLYDEMFPEGGQDDPCGP